MQLCNLTEHFIQYSELMFEEKVINRVFSSPYWNWKNTYEITFMLDCQLYICLKKQNTSNKNIHDFRSVTSNPNP